MIHKYALVFDKNQTANTFLKRIKPGTIRVGSRHKSLALVFVNTYIKCHFFALKVLTPFTIITIKLS